MPAFNSLLLRYGSAYRRLLLGAVLIGLSLVQAQAQRFWQTTPTFPGGPKLGLVATNDSIFFTVVADGVLRTRNQGRTWQLALRTPRAQSLFVTRAGQVLVGAYGAVFRSPDAGLSWDSVALTTPHPVVEFTQTATGELLAASGELDDNGDFVGEGCLFSANQGQSWAVRNNGLGSGHSVSHVAADRFGRVYLTVNDHVAAHQPGLYISDDKGLNWRLIGLSVDSRGAFPNALTPYQSTSLTITPQDSLICGFEGVAGPVAIRLNLKKSLADVPTASFWGVVPTFRSAQWWYEHLLNTVYVAHNGDWYSSRSYPSSSLGGTLRSTDHGRSWSLLQSGLGVNINLERSPQHFVETTDGKLFMVQEFDAQVYWTQTRVVTAAKARPPVGFELFPNPTTGKLQLVNRTGQSVQSISLVDLRGRRIRTLNPTSAALSLDLTTESAGIYLLTATLADGQLIRQRVVKQ